jgi:2-polyprenyl-3-methyl-5-hydroxy-6-metoxy-1,4-benzoquinol methylase
MNMFSCINFPEFVHEKEPIDGKIEPVGKNEETIKKNTEQLHRMVLGKDQNIDAKYVQTFYNDISQGYEELITSVGSDRSIYVAKVISEFFPPNHDLSDLKVLDLAAGTGVLGPHLKKIGVTCMDAVVSQC